MAPTAQMSRGLGLCGGDNEVATAHPVALAGSELTLDSVLRDVFNECAAGRPVAVATVAATYGSSPRDPGAMLAVHQDGTVAGSISGGCAV